MAKIYEALEEAQKGRKGLEKPDVSSSHSPITPSSHPPSSHPSIPSLDMEEEMIRLHQSIDSVLPEPKRRIIQFIGSSEGEGTSTIVREFARVSALKFNEVVLLMEADHHRPDQHLFFNLKPDHGWEEVVRNDEPIDKALYQIGNTNLFIAPISQTSAPNYQTFDTFDGAKPRFLNWGKKRRSVSTLSIPRASDRGVEWVDSRKMSAFLEKLRNQFDLILIDSPPANTSPDGLGLSQKVDGVVLVLEAEKTRWPVAESVKERITRSGGKIIGVVFNKRRYYIPEWIYKRL